tara:strand:- start:1050 stop:1559 length:510 start_codon:yes stop_codon:yes gene_type:complete
MSFNIGNVAGRYAASFDGTSFKPRSLGQDGLLANDMTEALTMIPALNLEAETQLAKQGLVNQGALERQQLISDTYLQLDKLKAEREKTKMIADILFAGNDNVLGVTGNLLNTGINRKIQQSVLDNTANNPNIVIPRKRATIDESIDLSNETLTKEQKDQIKANLDAVLD